MLRPEKSRLGTMVADTRRADNSARIRDIEMQTWLYGGLGRPDGRLALFDRFGEPVDRDLVRRAIEAGLAEPWFASPMRPSWMVCRLTVRGRAAATRK